jgi:heat shock protein HtpX
VIIAGVIGFFAELLFRMMFQGGWRWGGGRSSGDGERGKGGGGLVVVIAIALVAVAWLLSVVIRFALSRKREYLADAGSVELTKNPDAMISALRKIEGRGEMEGATSAVMEMCIDNPREGFADLFATHPPIESRIAALIQFAGGHDPGPLALPDEQQSPEDVPDQEQPAPGAQPGPWTSDSSAPDPAPRPFLPAEPPVTLGGEMPPRPATGPARGPWGPRRQH